MSDLTPILRENFPQWMAIRNDSASLGAQFLSAFGIELGELTDYIDMFFSERFIDTINIGEIDIIYKTETQEALLNEPVYGDGVQLERVTRLDQFYSRIDDIYITENTTVYCRKHYDNFTIGGIPHVLEIHHVWNAFDELGLLLGVTRKNGESNVEFKERILDVFRNPPSSTIPGLKTHLERALGKSVDIQPLYDIKPDAYGHITPDFASYIAELSRAVPFTWDTALWDDTYWNTVKDIAFDYLPHIYNPDLSMWKKEEFQSGIGDNDDLEVIMPSEEPDEQSFTYEVGLAGIVDRTETIHTEHKLKYKVYAKGQKASAKHDPINAKYSIMASEDVPFEYDVTGHKVYTRKFNDEFDGTYESNNIQIIPGNTISNPDQRKLRVYVDFKSINPAQTPTLHSIGVKWRDVNNTLQTITLSTAEELTYNDPPESTVYPVINTDLNSVMVDLNGDVVLGHSPYSRTYNTVNSWKDGILENVKSTHEGLVMILPTERI